MTDHKAEAERLTKLAGEIDSTAAASSAVAHATLYLAEQQRISNLIAAREMVSPKYKSWNGSNPPEDLYPITAEIILEGLGLL